MNSAKIPAWVLATLVSASPLAAVQSQPPRFRSGGSFIGTLGYDAEVGYDYGQYDDNGRERSYYLNNRGRQPRMPGKRADPGDVDFIDPYYQGYLYNEGSLADYDDLRSALEHHGEIGRRAYWRASRFIPLRYDDYHEYQNFSYELGGGGM